MPKDNMSDAERRYNELAAKHFAEYFTKLQVERAEPKRPTCPYCGSTELTTHRIPLERTATETFCDDCGKSWIKE